MGRPKEPRKTNEHVYAVKNFHFITNPFDKREKTTPDTLGVALEREAGDRYAKLRAELEIEYMHDTLGMDDGGFHVEESEVQGVKMFYVTGARTQVRHQAFYADPLRVIR